MRYLVRHRSSYQYAQPVVTSFHRLHLIPRSDHGQVLEAHRIDVDHPDDGPSLLSEPFQTNERLDCYGNTSSRLELLRPYSSLSITSWSVLKVERRIPQCAAVSRYVPIDSLHPDIEEFGFNSLHVHRHPELAAYAEACFGAEQDLMQGIQALTETIFRECTYDPEATDIATAPLTTLKTKRGVCQDFAHLGIACLRSIGIPAAYVSGYLETVPPAGTARLTGADASHAWFAAYVPQCGWVHADPTNGVLVGNHHVVTAIGRDFADVSPVIGIIYGGGAQSLHVAVDVIPEAEWQSHPLYQEWLSPQTQATLHP